MRDVPRRIPSTLGGLVYLIVVAASGLGLLVVAFGPWRRGVGLIGVALIAGDVAQSVYDVAGWGSPNPGGVGPMTRAMLLSNVVAAAEASSGSGLGSRATA